MQIDKESQCHMSKAFFLHYNIAAYYMIDTASTCRVEYLYSLNINARIRLQYPTLPATREQLSLSMSPDKTHSASLS